MSNNKRVRLSKEACEKSVYARYLALSEALNSIKSAPKELIEACTSTVALTELDLPSKNITRLGSRNTLYKYANQLLFDIGAQDGKSGWEYLDWLREEVKREAEKQTNSRKKSARESRDKGRDINMLTEISQLRATMLLQSKAYLSLLQDLSGLSKNDRISETLRNHLEKILSSHHDLFSHLFTPESKLTLKTNNVSKLRNQNDED